MQTAGEDSKKTKPAARKKSKEIKVVDKIYRLYYKQTYEYEKLLLIKVNHKHIQKHHTNPVYARDENKLQLTIRLV